MKRHIQLKRHLQRDFTQKRQECAVYKQYLSRAGYRAIWATIKADGPILVNGGSMSPFNRKEATKHYLREFCLRVAKILITKSSNYQPKNWGKWGSHLKLANKWSGWPYWHKIKVQITQLR